MRVAHNRALGSLKPNTEVDSNVRFARYRPSAAMVWFDNLLEPRCWPAPVVSSASGLYQLIVY
jgi:hypothetical protein